MATRYDAFWSFSLHGKSELRDIRLISGEIYGAYQEKTREAKREPNAFYVCEAAGYGEMWRHEILRALEAPVLIPVITKDYFDSAYCFFEWLAYTNVWETRRIQSGERDGRVGVYFALDLTNVDPETLVVANPAELLARLRQQFGPNGSPDEKELWRSAFEGRLVWDTPEGDRYIRERLDRWAADFRKTRVTRVADSAKFLDTLDAARIPGEILNARMAFDVRSSALEKYDPALQERLQGAAQLALFCLAFDRFHDGGWGFSLEDDYAFEDEGRVVATGTDEVNLLAIRALRVHLDEKNYIAELGALTARLDGETRANLGITDRKQHLTGCLLSLISQQQVLIGDRASVIVTEATAANSGRWIVRGPNVKDDGAVLQYVFGQNVLEALRQAGIRHTLGGRFGPGLDAETSAARLEKQLKEEQGRRRRELSKKIESLSQTFGDASPPADGARGRGANVHTALQLYFLLKDRDFVAENRAPCLYEVRRLNANTLMELPLPELALLCLILGSLLRNADPVGTSAEDDESIVADFATARVRFGKLWARLQARVAGADTLLKISEMNAVGWAALLLLCERQGVTVANRLTSVPVWKNGLYLRRQIGNEVRGQFASAELLRGSLVKLVAEPVGKLCVAGAKFLSGVTTEQWQDFAEHVLKRGILLEQPKAKVPPAEPAAPHVPATTHVGMLEVEKMPPSDDRAPGKALRVRSADAGYGRLFLTPFAERTGLRADNLTRMIRHFGGGDDQLVENIARIVVNRCFVVEENGLVPVDFATRTRQIVEALTTTDGVAEQDILELHGSSRDDLVYVRRNATLFAENNLGEGNSQRLFYRWLFSEMTAEWRLANYKDYIRKS